MVHTWCILTAFFYGFLPAVHKLSVHNSVDSSHLHVSLLESTIVCRSISSTFPSPSRRRRSKRRRRGETRRIMGTALILDASLTLAAALTSQAKGYAFCHCATLCCIHVPPHSSERLPSTARLGFRSLQSRYTASVPSCGCVASTFSFMCMLVCAPCFVFHVDSVIADTNRNGRRGRHTGWHT